MEHYVCKHCHHTEIDDLSGLLGTDLTKGLGRLEAKNRLQEIGPNVITHGKKKSSLIRFLEQFHNPLIYILLAASIITLILGEYIDSSVIFAVVLVNAVIGFVQESKAHEAIEALKMMVKTEASVIRGGKILKIASEDIVHGDIVEIRPGDKVPADMRLFHSKELQVDESSLTGESVPSLKVRDLLPKDTPLADRKNMLYAGTLVTNGSGRGIVIATGNRTETGRIAAMVAQAEDLQTPLTKQIARFSRVLLFIILGLGAFTFFIGLMHSEPILDMFMASVALAVGAIPEGLPAAVTITLAIGVNRMAKRRAIIRKLPAVETLGSTTVICSDKTGTLTENQMTVKKIFCADEFFELTGTGYKPEGEIRAGDEQVLIQSGSPLLEVLLCGLLCNESSLIDEDGRWKINGDPTEGALIVAAKKARLDENAVIQANSRVDLIPFSSDKMYMATLNRREGREEKCAFVKGSAEKILERCSDRLTNQAGKDLDKTKILEVMEKFAGEGLRVLAFASKYLPKEKNSIEHADIDQGLTFLGLQAMIDPPRAEAIEAVKACHTAGIKVKMITGDHATTAEAIAAQLGLQNDLSEGLEGLRAITGKELSQMDDEELISVIDKTTVFARVEPSQKLRLVDALQEKNNVVAMTGDGVNDAPALKQANIGIAMGISGTEVAKEASDIILTDDNFASIKAAVEEGRGVFDNITKFILWTLPTNLGEGLVILAAIVFAIKLPILPVQILWINMTTAVLLGLMLAFEPKEKDIMTRLPRDLRRPIITKDMLLRLVTVSAILLGGAFYLFERKLAEGDSAEAARTAVVNAFIFVELFYLFTCRSLTKSMFAIGVFSNPFVWAGVGAMILLQILYTYLPIMNRFFHSAPIGIEEWLQIIGMGILAFIVVELEKLLRRKYAKRRLENGLAA